MSDKKEQLQMSPPEAIEEVEERSDEDDAGDPKSATAKAGKSKATDASKNAKAPPKKKSMAKAVRGASAATALAGGISG